MLDTKQYRTRSVFWDLPNYFDGKTWVIGADIGYSGVKVISPALCACFPSYAIRLYDDRSIMEINDEYILYENHDTGEKWLVGQYAQDSISDRDTSVAEDVLFSRDRYESPMYRVLVDTAVGVGLMPGKVADPGGCAIVVQTGYPPLYEDDAGDLVEAFVGERHFSLTVGKRPKREFRVKLTDRQIFTMSQPMGALFSVSVDNNGMPMPEMRDIFSKNILVFDAGFGTLDCFTVVQRRMDTVQTNQQFGMKRVMQETCRKLKEQGVNVSVPALQKYLNSGYAIYETRKASKKVPFADILEECSRTICLEALDWTRSLCRLGTMDMFVITGGTCAAWSPIIREELKNYESLTVVEGSKGGALPLFFNNVRGYYLYRVSRVPKSSGDKS